MYFVIISRQKASKQTLSNKCMSKIKKAPFVMLHPYDCPVKTNHMIGVLIRFEK